MDNKLTQKEAKALYENWGNLTGTQKCIYWQYLDYKYETVHWSPLHHDNRCEIHTLGE